MSAMAVYHYCEASKQKAKIRSGEIKMNVAVLGTGFGAYHVGLLKEIEEIDTICVFGRNPEKLAALKEKFGVDVTTSMDRILEDREIELVDICLPGYVHREYLLRCLEKGKHVFCETPFALTRDDANQMVNAACQYRKKVCVDTFMKFAAPYKYLFDMQKSRCHGLLKSLRIYRKTPPIWGDLGLEHITIDLMIHDLDIAAWLCGKPARVDTFGVTGNPGQSEVTGMLTYDGCNVQVTGNSMMPVTSPFSVGYEAIFERAAVYYYEDSFKDRVVNSLEVFTAGGVEKVYIPRENVVKNALRHMVDCVETDDDPLNNIEAANVALQLSLDMKELIMNKVDKPATGKNF